MLAIQNMNAVYARITENIIRLIEENRVLPWIKPWFSCAMPANAAWGRPYGGINSLILAAAAYEDHRWLTYKQATLDLRGNVRKGERATQVVLWKFDVREDEDGKPKQSPPLVRTYSFFFNANVGRL